MKRKISESIDKMKKEKKEASSLVKSGREEKAVKIRDIKVRHRASTKKICSRYNKLIEKGKEVIVSQRKQIISFKDNNKNDRLHRLCESKIQAQGNKKIKSLEDSLDNVNECLKIAKKRKCATNA